MDDTTCVTKEKSMKNIGGSRRNRRAGKVQAHRARKNLRCPACGRRTRRGLNCQFRGGS